ncbi:AAA domain-containing protein [Clostridium gasigenes]|uniref:AAA domain-containing protein n=1 Tax=Clostridium gasigenes TaxID=94869 RepID=UPI001C0DE4AF|nr:AAA family ATPase [Clostridium gasigenes]
MNIKENLIFIRGEDETSKVQSYRSFNGKCHVKYTGADKEYGFNYSNIEFYKANNVYEGNSLIVYKGKMPISGVTDIIIFDNNIRLIYKNGSHQLFSKSELSLEKNVLSNKKSNNVFSYLKELAKNIIIDNESESFLFKQYKKITQISPRCVLAKYIEGKEFTSNAKIDQLIFPFGFNISQKDATEKAIMNQLSVIEGPPGTGKTQTILNIIANAYIDGKSVAVVSNNNSATSNVFEKLDKYGVGFIAAFLGNKGNKEKFIAEQSLEYSDMSNWKLSLEDKNIIKEDLNKMKQQLNKMLEHQNHIAKLKNERDKLITEKIYYDDIYKENEILNGYSFVNKISSKKAVQFLAELQLSYEREEKIVWLYKLRNVFRFGLFSFKFYNNSSESIIALLQNTYYKRRLNELDSELESLEAILDKYGFKEAMKVYSDKSMIILKDAIASRKHGTPPIFTSDDLWKSFDKLIHEYPIILSTTHSLSNCISKNYIFDYVIIDEASQVDIVTGALAFNCAKNAVIVGDLKQLPNVVSKEFKKQTKDIFKKYNIAEGYSYGDESLLSSITKMYPKIAKTLLKEHYRCNPKIIGFCNEKFYNNELIILTENNEENPLIVYKTNKGNNARGTFNQREIDVILKEVIPDIKTKKSIGIISPYRKQANTIKSQVGENEIEVDTVHKYQGREKDIIILTTVANQINDFIDGENLINVAVSRAVNKLVLVVSGNEEMQSKQSNISDLVRYVKYNNYEVINSKINSVFDLLYKQYKLELLEVMSRSKKVSEYDSENLMNIVIEKVLENESYRHISCAMHQPLRLLIKDTSLLTEEESAYAKQSWTHTDFILFNKIDKGPILVVEVDGYGYHENNEKQLRRDRLKDSILEKYNIPMLRIKTTGSNEYNLLVNKLENVIDRK